MKTSFKTIQVLLVLSFLLISGCTVKKNLGYLNNLPEVGGEETFALTVPEYKVHKRDILYITIKSMSLDGTIKDFLSSTGTTGVNLTQGESGSYLYGYDVNMNGKITLPVIGQIDVEGLTLDDTRKLLQELANQKFNNSTVECKLISFKYTVLGEVKNPGTYINYNNYLTVFEAIGRAGGVGDFGSRNSVLVVRPINEGTKTFKLNLQDKSILTSEAYYLLPNDVIIVEPLKHKVFNLNLPTFSFIITTVTAVVTTTLLLINYFGK